MDNEQRAKALLEKEETENRIKELTSELREKAEHLMRFAHSLIEQPEKTTFAHFPNDVNTVSSELRHVESFDYRELPDYQRLAELAVEIRKAKDSLYWINKILGKG